MNKTELMKHWRQYLTLWLESGYAEPLKLPREDVEELLSLLEEKE